MESYSVSRGPQSVGAAREPTSEQGLRERALELALSANYSSHEVLGLADKFYRFLKFGEMT